MEGSDSEPEKSTVLASAFPVSVRGIGVSTAVKEALDADQDVARALDLSSTTPEGKAQQDPIQKFEEMSVKEQLSIMFSSYSEQEKMDMLLRQYTGRQSIGQSDLFHQGDPANKDSEVETHGPTLKGLQKIKVSDRNKEVLDRNKVSERPSRAIKENDEFAASVFHGVPINATG